MSEGPLSNQALASLADDGELLASVLDSLGLEALELAQSVAPGLHGRRRAGMGEDFWQYRRFTQGDHAHMIDWRRSARHEKDVLFVREKEWETAQTVWVWADFTPSMAFRSDLASSSKLERGVLLMLALTHMMVKIGERVGMPSIMAPTMRRGALRLMVEHMIAERDQLPLDRFPAADGIKAASTCVIFSDFLDPATDIDNGLARLAEKHVDMHLVEILDPAEEDFPYAGRVEFRPVETGKTYTAGRAEMIKDRYKDALQAHREEIRRSADRHGATILRHRTDQGPETALLALAASLTGSGGGYAHHISPDKVA